MHIGILTRESHEVWGGDLKIVYDLKAGLEALKCTVTISASVLSVLEADWVILTNSTRDLRPHVDILRLYKIPFAVLCFHEDCIQYASPCFGFANYLEKCLERYVENGVAYSLDRLLETPEIIHYFGFLPMRSCYYNHDALQEAKVCIVNSVTEERTLKRDCPSAKTAIVPLSPGLTISTDSLNLFTEYTHLPKREYILQVGRFETRKNQLGSILSSRNLDVPLVFITMKTHQTWYEQLCLKAIQTYRPYPTLVISETLESCKRGVLKIIKMPNAQKLSPAMVQSAFQNAGLYLHPAFYEVPGLVFFEAAQFNTPAIASEWCTIRDTGLNGLEYPSPWNINAIEGKIKKLFGSTPKESIRHSILSRTPIDYAKQILEILH